MSSEISKLLNLASPDADREYAACKNMVTLWDKSSNPSDNSNRVAKLGSGDNTHAVAVGTFDLNTLAMGIIDGYTLGSYSTRRPFEPDCFALRLHVGQGKGKDCVWALRLVAEHENKASKRGHRSTFVIDQRNQQLQAWLSDLAWVKKFRKGGKLEDDELHFDAAGFLSGLGGGGGVATSTPKRPGLMLNIARNAGFYTDGVYMSWLWHVLHINVNSSGTTAPEAGEALQGQGCLRGDVNFDMKGDLCHLAMGPPADPRDDPVSGWLMKGQPAPWGPNYELSKDDNSDHDFDLRSSGPGIRPVVLIPKKWTSTTTTTVTGQTGGPGGTIAQPTLGDSAGTGPGSTTYPAGQTTGVGVIAVLPDKAKPSNSPPVPVGGPISEEELGASVPIEVAGPDWNAVLKDQLKRRLLGGSSNIILPDPQSALPSANTANAVPSTLQIAVNIVVPAQVAAFPVSLRLDYAVFGPSEAVPSAWNATPLTASIGATYQHGLHARVIFNLPVSTLKDKGKMIGAFYRLTDTNPNALTVLGIESNFGAPTTS